MESIQQVIDGTDRVVVSKNGPEFGESVASLNKDSLVIDLVRIIPEPWKYGGTYEGICW